MNKTRRTEREIDRNKKEASKQRYQENNQDQMKYANKEAKETKKPENMKRKKRSRLKEGQIKTERKKQT